MILDTAYLIDYIKGKQFSNLEVVREASRKKSVYFNGIILTEILSNVRSNKERAKIEKLLSGLIYLPLRYSDFSRAGEIRNKLFQKGFSMSAPDSLIATHAKVYNLKVITMDSFFIKAGDLIGIKVEIPTVI